MEMEGDEDLLTTVSESEPQIDGALAGGPNVKVVHPVPRSEVNPNLTTHSRNDLLEQECEEVLDPSLGRGLNAIRNSWHDAQNELVMVDSDLEDENEEGLDNVDSSAIRYGNERQPQMSGPSGTSLARKFGTFTLSEISSSSPGRLYLNRNEGDDALSMSTRSRYPRQPRAFLQPSTSDASKNCLFRNHSNSPERREDLLMKISRQLETQSIHQAELAQHVVELTDKLEDVTSRLRRFEMASTDKEAALNFMSRGSGWYAPYAGGHSGDEEEFHQVAMSNNLTLNNQVSPGTRANNFYDNFRSYSHQNLLSAPKNFPCSSRESTSRTRSCSASTTVYERGEDLRNRRSASARNTLRGPEFVENIGTKLRNKEQENTPRSPLHRRGNSGSQHYIPMGTESGSEDGDFIHSVLPALSDFLRKNVKHPGFLHSLFTSLASVDSDAQRIQVLNSLYFQVRPTANVPSTYENSEEVSLPNQDFWTKEALDSVMGLVSENSRNVKISPRRCHSLIHQKKRRREGPCPQKNLREPCIGLSWREPWPSWRPRLYEESERPPFLTSASPSGGLNCDERNHLPAMKPKPEEKSGGCRTRCINKVQGNAPQESVPLPLFRSPQLSPINQVEAGLNCAERNHLLSMKPKPEEKSGVWRVRCINEVQGNAHQESVPLPLFSSPQLSPTNQDELENEVEDSTLENTARNERSC